MGAETTIAFDGLLKEYRLAAGLTEEALAAAGVIGATAGRTSTATTTSAPDHRVGGAIPSFSGKPPVWRPAACWGSVGADYRHNAGGSTAAQMPTCAVSS
jgi:hypothetical protein